MVNKSPKCSTWMQSQKRQKDLCSFPRQTIQYHSNPTLSPTCNAEEGGIPRRNESVIEKSKGQKVTLLGEKNEWFQVTREDKWRDGVRKYRREGEVRQHCGSCLKVLHQTCVLRS